MGNKFNPAAFFTSAGAGLVNTGAQAYTNQKRMKLEQEQQDWYKRFLEENAAESRKQQAALQQVMMMQFRFNPMTGAATPTANPLAPQVRGADGSILAQTPFNPEDLFRLPMPPRPQGSGN